MSPWLYESKRLWDKLRIISVCLKQSAQSNDLRKGLSCRWKCVTVPHGTRWLSDKMHSIRIPKRLGSHCDQSMGYMCCCAQPVNWSTVYISVCLSSKAHRIHVTLSFSTRLCVSGVNVSQINPSFLFINTVWPYKFWRVLLSAAVKPASLNFPWQEETVQAGSIFLHRAVYRPEQHRLVPRGGRF